ncbi:MAG: hypothetical protein KGZ85_16965 [Ignavibacterium sp.]|nr:hypothetical protein [Ignavibacterium sp.]
MVTEGIEFIDAKPETVIDYLKSRVTEKIEVNPANLKIVNGGRFLVLQLMNGKIREYPVRRTFLYKLLRWYGFPLGQLTKLSTESVTSICNDYLMNIKRGKVIVKTEKDEALSILSPDYNEITDLDIISEVTALGVRNISRNDFFLSITTEDKIKTEPVPGDKCGVGLNIVNSETGFRALTVLHYILRYTCSNEAVARISDVDDKRYHYGNEDLNLFLNEKVKRATVERKILVDKLLRLNDKKVNKSKEYYIKKIETVLGKKEATIFFDDYSDELTQYELFNLITSNAKQYDLSKRYFLESVAGEIIFSVN